MPQDYYPSGPFLGELPDKGKFDVLREDFLLGFRESTARAYKADLEDWWEWSADRGTNPLNPSEDEVSAYLVSVVDRGYSAGARTRRASALRGFLRVSAG
jgi:site-specific recombinase XerD